MQIIVCEDELLYQKSIDSKIEQWKQASKYANIKKAFFSSSEDFLEQWKKGLNADIILLDILFSHEMDGMALAKRIRETDQSVLIVFITNSEAYVKEGYAVNAFRYLNKPVCYDDIARCLDVAYKQHMTAAELNRQIEVSERQKVKLLPPQTMRRTDRAYRRMMNERKSSDAGNGH